MGDSPFLVFAERHDLDYAERVLRGAGAFGRKGLGEVAGGELPGGLTGLVGDHSEEVKHRVIEDRDRAEQLRIERSPGTGASAPTSRAFRDARLVVTRVPESTGFLPYVTCRDTVVSGFADRLIGPGGLIPIVDHVEFESIELNRRYRIGAFKGSENRLRQLFAPSLIDWMASTAPHGLYFELFGGVLMLSVTGKAESADDIEHACKLAAHLAEVIRSEAGESVAADGTPEYSLTPQQLEHERKQAETLAAAAFTSPPPDVRSAIERIEPVVGERNKGFFRRVFKSINEGETADLALQALLRGYGERNGMRWERPESFAARHVDLPTSMLPTRLLRGPLPGVGVEGDLFVIGAAHGPESECHPGAALPAPASPAVLQVAPEPAYADDRDRGAQMVIGGFPVLAGDGGRRLSARSKVDADVAAAIAEELGGGYRVIASRCEPGQTLTPALRAWLSDGEHAGKCMLQRAGATLAVLASPIPVEDWSVAMLDSFCESLAPLAAG